MLCEDIQGRLAVFSLNLAICAMKQQLLNDRLVLKKQQLIIYLFLALDRRAEPYNCYVQRGALFLIDRIDIATQMYQ